MSETEKILDEAAVRKILELVKSPVDPKFIDISKMIDDIRKDLRKADVGEGGFFIFKSGRNDGQLKGEEYTNFLHTLSNKYGIALSQDWLDLAEMSGIDGNDHLALDVNTLDQYLETMNKPRMLNTIDKLSSVSPNDVKETTGPGISAAK